MLIFMLTNLEPPNLKLYNQTDKNYTYICYAPNLIHFALGILVKDEYQQ